MDGIGWLQYVMSLQHHQIFLQEIKRGKHWIYNFTTVKYETVLLQTNKTHISLHHMTERPRDGGRRGRHCAWKKMDKKGKEERNREGGRVGTEKKQKKEKKKKKKRRETENIELWNIYRKAEERREISSISVPFYGESSPGWCAVTLTQIKGILRRLCSKDALKFAAVRFKMRLYSSKMHRFVL